MRKILFLLLCNLTLCIWSFAQNRSVSGTVSGPDGAPLPNVSVQVKNTAIGTTTNGQGQFTLQVPTGRRTLIFSYVGLASQEINVSNSSTINVALTNAGESLSEVVVVGYSSTTKQAFTGTAKVVSGEQLNNKAVSNVSQALAGEVAGVRVINTSGQPGTSATVRIRGIGSVNGNRDPLYVVDGVPYSGNISAINPNDIANMTVLKDAAATSIYGSRGANGVIVITTRNGRSKESFIEVDGRFGSNLSLLPRYDVIRSPEEFIELSWEALYNEGRARNNVAPGNFANTRLFSASGIDVDNNIWRVSNGAELIDSTTGMVRPNIARKFNPENWEDYAFQPSSRTEGNIRFGGGDAKTNYYTSFGYLNDIGYTIQSDFKRYNARVNLNHAVKSWLSTSLNLNYAKSTINNNGQESNSNSVFWFADNIPSIYPLFLRDSTGNLVADPIFGGNQFDYGETGRKFGSLTNAIADATYNTRRTNRNELTGNTDITFKFSPHLSMVNRLGVQYYNNVFVSRVNKFYGSAASQNGSIGQTKTELLNLNLLNMFRYNNKFGKHNIEALAAHEATDFRQSIASASGYNLVENNNLELNNAIVSNPNSSYTNTNRLESYFGQANYDYESTYYLSGTVRRDGSSRFTEGNAWGTFGSIGFGWVLSKMNFMRNTSWVDFLKFKTSYGILGDQEGLGYYPGVDRFDITNLNNNPSFSFVTKGNPNLTWETSKMFQTGIEFRLGSYLSGSVDYYVKNTDNLIFNRRIGPSIGYAIIQVNDGKLKNTGVEFELIGHLLKNNNFYLDLGINGEHFTNKITAMPIDPATNQQKIIDVQGLYGYAVGHSIFDFYTRNFSGVDPQDGRSTWTVYYDDLNSNNAFNAGEEVANLEQFLSENPTKQGSLKTATTKVYQQATQYYVGKSALPKVRGGINLSAGWKGIDLAVQLLYSIGGHAYDGAYATLMNNGLIGGNNWHTDIRKRWQNPGDVTDVPRISNNFDPNVNSSSSRFITNASFLSLNNIRLSYNLPSNLLRNIGAIDQVSAFVSGDNLWLASKRNGFNPSTAETGASNMYRYSPLSTITFGIRAKF